MIKHLNKHCCKLLLIASALILASCESGDSNKVDQAVRVADLQLESIEITPANGTIESGFSYQFIATGIQRDGSRVDITDYVTWASSDASLVSVNGSGFVSTAVGTDNSVSISASLSSIIGSTQLTTSTAPLESISIDDGGVVPSACRNMQLEAIGRYNGVDRNIIPITNFVQWSVTSANATISANGYLETSTDAVITVEASQTGALPGILNIDPADDLVSIVITPDNQSIFDGETLQFTATGSYTNGSIIDITSNVGWESDGLLIADFITASVNGRITAISGGTVTVTASCGPAVIDTTPLTVVSLTLDFVRFEVNSTEVTQTSVSLSGINSVEVELIAHYTDGSRTTITDDADWIVRPESSAIVSVSNSGSGRGVVTGLSVGTGIIDVDYNGQQYVFIVFVGS